MVSEPVTETFLKIPRRERFPHDFRLATVAEVKQQQSKASKGGSSAFADDSSLRPGRCEAFLLKDGYLFEFGTLQSFYSGLHEQVHEQNGAVKMIHKLGIRRSLFPACSMTNLDAALALMHACHEDDEEEVQEILNRDQGLQDGSVVRSDLRVRLPWANGGTVFHTCSEYGKLNLLRVLLQKEKKEGGSTNCPQSSPLSLLDNDGDTPLSCAALCKADNSAIIIELLEHEDCRCTINQRNFMGRTPLMEAVRRGHANTCEELLKAVGIDVTLTDAVGNTIMHLCARRNDPVDTLVEVFLNDSRVFKLLYKQNIEGDTPLTLALANGYSNFCEHVLKKRQADMVRAHDPNQDTFGFNILHNYATGGVLNVGELLLDQLGSSTYKQLINKPNIKGWTPFLMATIWGNLDAWDTLWRQSDQEFIRKFVDYETGNNILHFYSLAPKLVGSTAEELVHSMENLVNVSDDNGCTPIMYALQSGHNNACMLLLQVEDLQLDIDKATASDVDGNILHMYAHGGAGEETGSKLKCKLGDEKFKALISEPNSEGRTPLMIALYQGSHQASEVFLSADEISNTLIMKKVDGMGNNMLHLLCIDGTANEGLIKKLISLGTDSEVTQCINAKNEDGNTPLMCALKSGKILVCRLVIEAVLSAKEISVSLKEVNASKGNMFHCWCTGGDASAEAAELLEKLISFGTEVDVTQLINAPDDEGNTPLMCALEKGKTEHCRLLLEGKYVRGVNISAQNEKSGLNVFHFFALGSCKDASLWKQLKDAYSEEELATALNAQGHRGRTPLMYALKGSAACSLLFLREDSVVVNDLKDEDGDTILHYLTYKQSVDSFEVLLEVLLELRRRAGWSKGNLIHSKNKSNITPLMAAIRTSSLPLFEMLLEEVDTDSLDKENDDKHNLLHLVAQSNGCTFFQLMALHAGEAMVTSLMDKKDIDGRTPLMLAAFHGNVDACWWLLEKYGDKAHNAVENLADQSGRTALHLATLPYNVNRDRTRVHATISVLLNKVEDRKRALKRLDKRQQTVLHIAMAWPDFSNAPLLKYLLQECPELEEEDEENGHTPLFFAAMKQDLWGMHFLHKGNPPKPHPVTKQSLLHAAASSGSVIAVKKVLEICENLKESQFVDAEGKTALHVACKDGNIGVARVLIEANEKLANIPTSGGKTPLHEAARAGNLLIVKKLLSIGGRGSLLLERDADGRTALHFAAASTSQPEEQMLQVLQVLLDFEAQKGPHKPLLLYAYAGHVVGTAHDIAKSDKVKKYLFDQMKAVTKDLLQLAQQPKEARSIVKELINRGASPEHVQKEYLEGLQMDKKKDSDQPSMKDFLGRAKLAKGVAALLLNPITAIPVTVGIFGPWGMGKSSLMLQIESSLLLTINQRNLLPSHHMQSDFRGIVKYELSDEGKKLGDQISHTMKSSKATLHETTSAKLHKWTTTIKVFSRLNCLWKQSNLSQNVAVEKVTKLLQEHFSDYHDDWHDLYKGLALAQRAELVKLSTDNVDSEKTEITGELPSLLTIRYNVNSEETDNANSEKAEIIGELPSLLTIRYNAWLYEGELEASAGLALTIMKEMERWMNTAQWLRHCWHYCYRKRPGFITINVIIPIIIIVVVGGWVFWLVWRLLSIPNNGALSGFKYGSIPVSMLVITWTVLRNIMSVVKPASEQLLLSINMQKDQEQKLGFQQEVIEDIKFFKTQLCEQAGWGWRMLGWLWSKLVENKDHIPGTNIKKMCISKKNLRVIAFIDDLDRCKTDNYILQLLGAVNLILSVCKINVVVGMDRDMVEKVISKEYNDIDASEKFLQKIIQVPIDLYEPSQEEMTTFLRQQLGYSSAKDHSKDEIHDQAAGESQAEESAPTTNRERENDDVVTVSVETSSSRNNTRTEHPTAIRSNNDGMNVQDGPAIEFPVLVANYSDIEVKAFEVLHPKAKGDHKNPRNWKRLLNYHRLAWNIISQSRSEQVKNLEGWQQQLLVWVFVCYNWKPQMDAIIENWDSMFLVQESSEGIPDTQIGNEDASKTTRKDEDANASKDTKKDEDASKSNKKYNKALRRSILSKHSPSLYAIVNVWFLQRQDEIQRKGQTEQWQQLRDTLDRMYDVSMDGIQAFQNYRFHCKTGHLHWKPGMVLKV